jgi:hypothetical protein
MVAALPTIYSKPDSPLYFSPGKLRASKARKNVHAVAQAVMKVMAREMGDRALKRLPEMFDDELGETLFGGVGVKPPKICRGPPGKKSRTWNPGKPKLTVLLLKAFGSGSEVLPSDGKPIVAKAAVSIRTGHHCKCVPLSKLLARRAIRWIKAQHREALEASGEIEPDQMQCETRLDRALARVASDTLAYLSVLAMEARGEDEDAVLELHGTDQRLVGISTRGCGVVFDATGRTLFEAAVTQVLAQMENASIDARTHMPPPTS